MTMIQQQALVGKWQQAGSAGSWTYRGFLITRESESFINAIGRKCKSSDWRITDHSGHQVCGFTTRRHAAAYVDDHYDSLSVAGLDA